MDKKEVSIPVDSVEIAGNLVLPEKAEGIVIFAHGSGSSRFSERNNYVAEVLNEAGIATLLLDLLTPEEDQVYENRFNIPLLSERLIAVTHWCEKNPETKKDLIGYFGASTGAAAALIAASKLHEEISAVVSRGGRPDLAKDSLKEVKATTLLIVGSLDTMVIELNKKAFDVLECKKNMEIVKGATHLFEEPGTLEEVARLACEWFQKYL